MSTAAPSATAWSWPTEVLVYARDHQIEQYLEPLRELVDRLFPVRDALKVYVDQDPELRDVRAIVFYVRVTGVDLAQLRTARMEWGQNLFRICPAPLVHHFVLLEDPRRT
jgi:hypothetical protein